MKKGYIIFILIFLISFSSALELRKEVISDTISLDYGGIAKFNLIFSNYTPGSYTIYSLADVDIFPENFYLDDKKNSVEIEVVPFERLNNKGYYSFIVYIKDPLKREKEERLRIKFVDLRDSIEISSPPNLPGEEITLFLENKENLTFKNISIRLTSFLFDEEKVIDLEPFEKKEIKIKVNPEEVKKIRAGNYLVEGKFKTKKGEKVINGKLIWDEKKEIKTSYENRGFLFKEKIIKKENKGTVSEEINVEYRTNIFLSFFTSFNKKPDRVEINGFNKVYYWTERIEPSKELTIIIRENYLIIIFLIFAAITLLFFSKKKYSPEIVLRKQVTRVKTRGGEFALKVRVILTPKRDVRNVRLIDYFPAGMHIHKKYFTTEPSLINERLNRLEWQFGDLNAGEEKIITYIIYTKVGILGKINFKEAKASFEVGSKIKETFSNKVFFFSEQVKNH
ncbi:MAG: hypothetical protein QW273_03470 [Candidatus Pacearchaeota archaeon]